ncbi:HDOD domain-containing protein [Neptuniibacter sp.]|uniref:HDOD domain-containing protein n=1 Tax=Neptuniibacter sp. TaxID=1962643 RepID=UPI0026197D1E|nr:HDOD domain-containing protein [Neptuniibacter sp.]MCP4597426.1 HDOD domain-containing protein [Neptuniibacter sp.]
MSDMLYGADAWVEYLKERPLPVRNSVLRRLQRQLRDDNIPLQQINRTIKSDPVLCLHMVRKASELHQLKDSKVTSIDHAISSLGLNNIESVVGEATPLKLNPSSVSQKMYFRYIAISHHAATQATHWLEMRKAPFVDETYLASLFYGVGHWMLWQHAALHMSDIQVKIREEGIDPVLAETDILGCTIQEISQRLIELWNISELAAISLEHETSPDKKTLAQLHQRALGDPRLTDEDLREINHLVQEKFFPVKLANWIALTANLGWYMTKTMKVIDIINDFLKGEIADTINMLHKNCAHSARQYHVAGTLAPAAELLMLPSDKQINYRLSKKEASILCKTLPAIEKPVVEVPQPEPEEIAEEVVPLQEVNEYLDKNIYDQIAERFLKGFDLYTEPKHILQGLVQGINRGIGFNRTSLFIINHKKKQLQTGICTGFEDKHPIYKFQYSLEVPSLFKKLCEKPSCLWVKPENREQMLHMLPEAYHSWGNPNGFLLMSIFYGSTPLAIIHADYGPTGPEVSDFHHERLRYLCSASGLGLKKLKK